jgi:hypothetical protein
LTGGASITTSATPRPSTVDVISPFPALTWRSVVSLLA